MKTTREQREEFLQAYIKCAIWSTPEDDDRIPFDHPDLELSPKALERCKKDCDSFLEEMVEMPSYGSGEYSDTAMCGHDFWLTRNGHGAGFWDRGIGLLGDTLTNLAETFGECYLYVCGDFIEIE